MAQLSLGEVGLLLLLVLALMLNVEAREMGPKTLRRKKREWIIPPAKLLENTDYTHREFIAKIRSDKDKDARVEYYLSGPGANKPPFNLFVVDHDTGFVRITDILDREKYPSYNLTGIAKYIDGTTAEEDIPLTVTVLDQNDNPPYLELHTGSITEASKAGTFVMHIEGKDDDQADTINSEISYSIVSQEPEGTGHMFTIDEKTGKLYVKEPTLDRETCDFYKLVIKGSDLGGAAGGLTGTGTVEVKVVDINDNIPTLEKSEYTGSVDENVVDVIVMRIKALDKDLEHTDNWLTVFTIAKGNEENLFSIETDRETNEGILRLIKPLDYEDIQNLQLGLLIENVAPFVEGGSILMDVEVQVGEGGSLATGAGAGVEAGAGAGVGLGVDVGLDAGMNVGADVDLHSDLEGSADVGLDAGLKPGVRDTSGVKPESYQIKIAVNNVPEDPAFIPDTKNVPVSEDPNEAPEDGVITVFAAVDPDTGKPAEDVSYAKAYDPDNWFTIDEETAEIKLNKVPDRESPFLVNGTYIAKILAITKGMPAKTATGTIAIQVTDSNDHCPTLTTTHSSLCSDEKTVYITGFDEDVSPNSAPFTFKIIPEGTQGIWDIEIISETSAALHSREGLWPGSYEVQVEVLDAQGLSCPANEIFTVDVCTCVETEDCSLKTARVGTTSSELSAPAIGLLLIAMCLLLFIPLLLLLCQCGGADTIFPDQFSDLPFDAKEHLISYHTEGRGEDKEVPLQSVPTMLGTQKKVEMAPAPNFNTIPSQIIQTYQTTTYDESFQEFQETSQTLMEVDNAYRFSRESFNNGNVSATFGRQALGVQHTAALYEDIALPDAFLNEYYSQKAVCALPVKDGLLEYHFEGQGSSAGSVGCCSLLESDNNLQFLNNLGSKFKTLAEICSPPTPTPKPSLTSTVVGAVKTTVDIVEPVVKPKIEQCGEIRHTDIKTENVMSSTNISKSSSTVSNALASMTLPRSKVTNIHHSSNISHSATLPCQAQTVVLQQQPVYYTTSSVLQPMHYIVQPHLQNNVLLTDGTHGANFQGLYVVNGPQNPSGLLISGPQGSPSRLVIQGIESSKTPASPTSPVSPTLLLPVRPGVSQGSVPVDGWKIMGPNPDGNYMLAKGKSSPGEAEGMDPGSSKGTLPRDAVLVKEAAPPQGVLGPAAQESVYGILPGHTVAKKGCVDAVNRNLGKAWVGQPGEMELVTVLGVGVGQPRMGMGHVVAVKPEARQAEIGPACLSPVGIRQVSVNQFQGIPRLEQTAGAIGIPKACRIDSPKKDNTIYVVNTDITAETTKKVVLKDDSDPAQKMHNDTVKEKPSEDVITYTSEQDTTFDYEDPTEVVQSTFEDNEEIQEYRTQTSDKPSIIEDIVKPLRGPDVLQTSFDVTGAPTNKLRDVISRTTESNDQQENTKEKAKDLQLEQGNTDKVNKETTFPQGEEAASTSDHISIVVDKEEGTPVQLSIVEGPKDRGFEVGSENESNEISEDRSERELEEDVGPAEKVVSDLEIYQEVIATSESTQAEENMEEMITVNSDVHEEVRAEQVQLSHYIGGDELPATPSNEISTDIVNWTEERSTPDQEAMAKLQVDHREGGKIDDGHAKTDIADTEAKTSLQIVSTILINQDEGDLGDPNLISASDEITTQAPVEGSNVQSILKFEQHLLTTKDSCGHIKEDDNQQNMTSGSGVEKVQAKSNADSISDGEKEEIIVEEVVSQQSFSTYNDQDEDTEQQHALSTSSQMEDMFISDDNSTDEEKDEDAVEEMVSLVQQNISFLDYQDEESVKEDASHTSSQMDDTMISDYNINVVEKEEEIVEVEALPQQQNFSITDEDEEIGREDAGSLISQVEDQPISDDNIRDGAKEEDIVEKVVSLVQRTISISDDDEASIKEDASERSPPMEDQLITDGNIKIKEKEECIVEEVISPVQKTICMSEEDEDSEKEDASHTSSHVEDKLNSEGSVSDGEKEEIIVEEVVSQQSFSTYNDQDEDTEQQHALSTSSQMEDMFISDDNSTDEEKDEDAVEEMVSLVQQNISFLDYQDEESAKEDASHTSSQMDDTMISDYNINVVEKEEEIVEVEALPKQQNFSITDEDEEIGREDAGSLISQVEDQPISDENIRDGAKEEDIVEKVVSLVQRTTSISDDDEASIKEDASGRSPPMEDQLITDGNIKIKVKEECIVEEVISPVQKTICMSEEDEDSEKEDASHTSSHVEDKLNSEGSVSDGEKEQESTESYQMLEEDSRSLDTECLSEDDPCLESQHSEINQVTAMSVTETQKMPCNVTTHQVRPGIDSSQIGDITLGIAEKQDTVGQELVKGTNMEVLSEVVTSSEEPRSPRVATGLVSMSSEDKRVISRMTASGHVSESEYQNIDIIKIERSEGEVFSLEEGKAKVTFDREVREGLEVSPDQMHHLYSNTGSTETVAASFIARSDVAEEAGYLVQNEGVHMTGEAAGLGPNTAGKAGSIEVVSKAGGVQVSPIQLQTVICQTPRNQSRKSKKDSNKSLQSPKSPSEKCKQQ